MGSYCTTVRSHFLIIWSFAISHASGQAECASQVAAAAGQIPIQRHQRAQTYGEKAPDSSSQKVESWDKYATASRVECRDFTWICSLSRLSVFSFDGCRGSFRAPLMVFSKAWITGHQGIFGPKVRSIPRALGGLDLGLHVVSRNLD